MLLVISTPTRARTSAALTKMTRLVLLDLIQDTDRQKSLLLGDHVHPAVTAPRREGDLVAVLVVGGGDQLLKLPRQSSRNIGFSFNSFTIMIQGMLTA